MKYKRIFTIVVDSFGIGNAIDAKEFGDEGSHTFAHILEAKPDLNIPNMMKLGLGDIGLGVSSQTMGYALALNEASVGKDTMTGHWEMMGLHITEPFQTFTETGFPDELLQELSKQCDGRKILGNKATSGTVILDELALEEIHDHGLIVYTSADSVLQICGHEPTMGLDTLYRYCKVARELTMKPEWKVGRVIARPYIGDKPGEFKRTSNRHDYALKPYGTTALDLLNEAGLDCISVGKIRDIFDGQGITQAHSSKSSVHGMQQTIEMAKQEFIGLCFTNLVDFDALWGHRRDPIGYGKELESFDKSLGELMSKIKEDDLIIVCADHGNDPTYKGTDHTREKVPCLLYSPSMKKHGILKDAKSFALIGQTILDNFGIEPSPNMIGESIYKNIE